MRPSAALPALLFAAGCFSPAGEPLSFETLPFSNDYTQFPDIVLRPFEFEDLKCPDGEPSVFYAVYREGLTEPAPIVLFFHAGAFDYVNSPDPTDPDGGPGYQSVRRFSAEWAGDKVFETFGLLPGDAIDPAEINEGTLPAALADQGAFTLYPANCWGDLWHNEDYYQPNQWDSDGSIHRQGRFLAWWMTRIASKDATEAADWQATYDLDLKTNMDDPTDTGIPVDTSGIYIVGLGEGGRAAAELLSRAADPAVNDTNMPAVKGMLMDSTMDNLWYLTQHEEFARYQTGLDRIFPEETDIAQYSMIRWINNHGLSVPLEVYWSSADPQVPDETLSDLVGKEAQYPTFLNVTDVGTTGHVFLNNDAPEARRAITRMFGE